jgi:small subunit ribosomal protein S6
MRKYEILYIINASLEEAARQEVIENMKNIIVKGNGVVSEVTEWGMREFAYEINHMTKGYYVLMNFEADTDTVKELDRLNRINAKIIRFLVVNLEDK